MRVKAKVDPEKREWRRFDSTKSYLPKSSSRKSSGNPVPGLFAGATQETPSVDEKLTKKCPVHNSTRHTLEPSLGNCPLSRKRNPLRNINFACLVFRAIG